MLNAFWKAHEKTRKAKEKGAAKQLVGVVETP
jgi:hypothetical protein